MRSVTIETGVMKYAEGSARIECGDTIVLVSASVEGRVPSFRQDSGLGWVTAEYSMLPRATHTRNQREVNRGRPSGRTSEIQRLIGRALRAVIDMKALGEVSVLIDCDVLQADGGTRTASITGAYVAMVEALSVAYLSGDVRKWPLETSVAAISVGMLDSTPLLDLEYIEDSAAQVDMNVVATGEGELIEVQGTAEQGRFSRRQLDGLLDLAQKGIGELTELQNQVLAGRLEQVEAKRNRSSLGGGKVQPRDEAELWGKP
jgi:ribonuclease PH